MGIALTPEQEKIARTNQSKLLVAAGEGAGKTFLAGAIGAIRILYDVGRNGFADDGKAVSRLYWVPGQSYEDAFTDFKEILTRCEQLGIVDMGSVHIRDSGRDICDFTTKYGQFIETRSGADPTTIARVEPDGIIGAEASRWSTELWHRVMGRLSRRARFGSWGLFTGSFESSVGPFADWFKLGQSNNGYGLRSYSMPTWTNTHIYPGGYDDPQMKFLRDTNTKDRFMERYGGQPAPPKLAVLPEFSTALHVDDTLEYEPGADTYIFVDPGDFVYAVLFVQVVGSEFRVVESIYAHKSTHEAVIAEAKLRPGWKHTQKTRRVIMDVAGFQHHAGASCEEIWSKATGYWVTGERIPVEATVDKIRTALLMNPTTGKPRTRIHPSNRGMLAEAGAGPSPVQGGGMWTRFSENGRPRAENDHAWKAFGYGLIGLFGTDMPVDDNGAYAATAQGSGASYLKWRVVR